MFKNILVAIDEPKLNEKLLNAVEGLVIESESEITLVHVMQDNITYGLPYVPKQYVENMLGELEKESAEKLKAAEEVVASFNKEASINLVSKKGDPAKNILEVAKDQKADIIIIGSRGLSGVQGLMLGSVSHKVSQLSQCPVLIVH